MTDACCCIDVTDTVTVLEHRLRKARKPHRCGECRRTIPAGARYWFESWVFEGEFGNHKTCELCMSVRNDRFPCGFAYGYVWADLLDCLAEYNEPDRSWLDPPTHPIIVES